MRIRYIVLGSILVGILGLLVVSIPSFLQKTHVVVLEVRSGAGGGNPNRVDMSGKTSIYVKNFSRTPLNFSKPPTMRDKTVAHCDGGFLPKGKAFVIQRIDFTGTTAGDSNGRGSLALVVAGKKVVEFSQSNLPINDSWTGHLVVAAGSEQNTYLEVRNSSAGRAVLEGYLTDVKTAGQAPRKSLQRTP